MEVRPEVFETYNSEMDQRAAELIWVHESIRERNYYVNDAGRSHVFAPWRIQDYYARLSAVKASDYCFL
jgi:hypothetical protein